MIDGGTHETLPGSKILETCRDGLGVNYFYIYIVMDTGTCRCCILDVYFDAYNCKTLFLPTQTISGPVATLVMSC